MSEIIGRLESKHWMLIAGFLTATATIIGGFDHWGDATKPAVVAGFLGQLAVLIGSLYAGAPPNPNNWHQRRRHTDVRKR
jgi:hypothetical protein